jgi:membrane protease YdiL (CAAX protease family)
MYLLIKRIPRFDIPKKNMKISTFIGCACVTYTIMYLSNLIGIFINSSIGKITGKGGVNPIIDLFGEMSVGTQILAVVILAPIFEELLFRKFLLDRVANYGEAVAVILSGVMFGLYHGNLSQFVYATTLGCFFAFVYLKTGKIIYTILLHIILNGMATFIMGGLFKGVNISEMMGYINNGDMDSYTQFVQ